MKRATTRREKRLLFATLLTVFLAYNEYYFRDDLFNFSLDFIPAVQEALPPSIFKYPFKIVSAFSDPMVIITSLSVLFIVPTNKIFIVKLVAYITTVTYLLSLIKSIYGNPRPYWVRPLTSNLQDPGIIPLENFAEYGNPSGHVFFAIGFYGYLCNLYIQTKKKAFIKKAKEALLRESVRNELQLYEEGEEGENFDASISFVYQQSSQAKSVKFSSFTVKFVSLSLLLTIAFSRLYLGMHTLNQLALGLSFGTYNLFINWKYVDPALTIFLKNIFYNNIQNKLLLRFKLTLSYILISLVPTIVYIIRDNMTPFGGDSEIWGQWWKVVHQELGLPRDDFAYIGCYLDTGIIGAIYGLIFGVIGNNKVYTKPSIRISEISKSKLFLRMIVGAGIIIISILFLRFVPIGEDNFILEFFLRYNLTSFVASYFVARFVPYIYLRLKLTIEGDFVSENLMFNESHIMRPEVV